MRFSSQNETLFLSKLDVIFVFHCECDVFAGEAYENIIAMFLVLADYWTDDDKNTGV